MYAIRSYYAGKLRVLSLFEPYQLHAYNDFYEQSGNKKILLNVGQLSACKAIRVMTAADYFWNTSEYNADKALWIVITSYSIHYTKLYEAVYFIFKK